MVAIDLAVDVAVAKFPGVSAIDWVPQALVVGLAIDPVADKAVGVPAIDLVADKVVEEAVGVPATDPAVDRVADKAVEYFSNFSQDHLALYFGMAVVFVAETVLDRFAALSAGLLVIV
mgnify:CR=1 FL=1